MTNMERRIGIRGIYLVLWLMTESLSININISIEEMNESMNETEKLMNYWRWIHRKLSLHIQEWSIWQSKYVTPLFSMRVHKRILV